MNCPKDLYDKMKFPEIRICNANRMNKTYLENHNISENLTEYIKRNFRFDMTAFGANLEKYYHLEKQYKDLLARYPRQDIREFMIQASVRCETFVLWCSFDDIVFNCCEKAVPTFNKGRGGCYLLSDIGTQKANLMEV